MDKNYLTLSRGEYSERLITLGCRGSKRSKKSIIYYTLRSVKGYIYN